MSEDKRRTRRWAHNAATFALIGLVVTTAFSALAELHWFAELFVHFRFQMMLSAAVLLVACLLLRRIPTAVVAALCLAANGVPMLPYFFPSATTRAGSAPTIRLLLANVQRTNREHHRLLELVRVEKADIVFLLEVNQRWAAALGELSALYPYSIRRPQENNFGLAVFSRLPLDELETRALGSPEVPALLGRLTLGERRIQLLVAHAVPPLGARGAALRNRQLEAIPDLRHEFSEDEFMLVGDLNTTLWSPHYRNLERAAGLQSAGKGLGIHPTWPVGVRPLMIPIDHVMISEGLRSDSYELGPPIGSDHLPVLVQIRGSTAPPTAKRETKESDGFAQRLVAAALERTHHRVTYDGSYRQIPYPGGDVPDHIGVCTDLVIRAYRAVGVDLQQTVHEDMRSDFEAYPKIWGLAQPDRNIDHRRVPNLQRFLSRTDKALPISEDPADYRPGDLVTWMLPENLPHIGIVAGQRSSDGVRPLIIHNIGRGPKLEDKLFAFPITGHYRYVVAD